ncbi:protein of unknown function [Magnetospirillum sp. XM-1]|uniref:hypothetical protein n=1 Tax=Magnetospirillum sp. XM-1 TaxID=1663591 RepID=UPI00073DD89A|nr:hypothetical protein [Magnetospirillum sp. XM-1]CUW41697.1 protein of unknown function [Magnetospirillum sp. XM-1]
MDSNDFDNDFGRQFALVANHTPEQVCNVAADLMVWPLAIYRERPSQVRFRLYTSTILADGGEVDDGGFVVGSWPPIP